MQLKLIDGQWPNKPLWFHVKRLWLCVFSWRGIMQWDKRMSGENV